MYLILWCDKKMTSELHFINKLKDFMSDAAILGMSPGWRTFSLPAWIKCSRSRPYAVSIASSARLDQLMSSQLWEDGNLDSSTSSGCPPSHSVVMTREILNRPMK